MSIQSEIDRIAGAKPILGNYLRQNGVAVPTDATLDENGTTAGRCDRNKVTRENR